MAFCRAASALPSVKERGWIVDLPTEAEWEYCCRAGTATRFCYGDNVSNKEVNCNMTAKKHRGVVTKKVYSLPPNQWGLYDMHGNVAEWCKDWYDESYYQSSGPIDPQGPVIGVFRILRGGSAWHFADECRSGQRDREGPNETSWYIGFRVVTRVKNR